MGYMFGWVDAHGAGCQRSDPKDGSLSEYTYVPYGYYFGDAPQGDAIRLHNYVRCVRDADGTGIDGGDGSDDVGAVRFSPNPFRDSTGLTFSVPAGIETATCAVLDVSGRVVRTIVAAGEDGKALFVWDGQCDDDNRVAAGVYFALVEADGYCASSKLVLLR
jgi:hypothetical protein